MMTRIAGAGLAAVLLAGVVALGVESAGVSFAHPVQLAAEQPGAAPMMTPRAVPRGYMMGPGGGAWMMGPGGWPMMMMPMMGMAGPMMMAPALPMGPYGPMMHGRGGGMPMGPHAMMWSGGEGPDWDLSTDDVRKYFENAIAWQGFKRLKVGKVEKKDDDVIVAEIVTKDDSLVQRYEVSRHSGVLTMVE